MEDASDLQKATDEATAILNNRKMRQNAIRIADQVELILPAYKEGEVDERILSLLERLQFASEDLARRVDGTPYEFIGELTMAMVDLADRITAQYQAPDTKVMVGSRPRGGGVVDFVLEEQDSTLDERDGALDIHRFEVADRDAGIRRDPPSEPLTEILGPKLIR